MIEVLIALAVSAGVGFGVGRIKSSKTISEIKAEAAKVEAGLSTDAKALIAKIKAL